MMLIDSSVWIDYFNARESAETDYLDNALINDIICLGDIVLAKVLQGFQHDRDYRTARDLLTALPVYQMLNPELALVGAENYRRLRKRGITIRKSVNVWIATFCIEKEIPLLFSDRDFLPFVRYLNLATPLSNT